MRFDTRVLSTTSAFCCSIDDAFIGADETVGTFRSNGFAVLEDGQLSSTRGARVLYVVEESDAATQTYAHARRRDWNASAARLGRTETRTRATFVPVWSASATRLGPLGMSLLLQDEAESFPALDALHAAAGGHGTFAGLARHDITVRPHRGLWGYG